MENEMGAWSSEDAVVSDVCVVNGGGERLFKLLANINRDNTVPGNLVYGEAGVSLFKKNNPLSSQQGTNMKY